MSKDYAEHRENRENLIDIAGLFDNLVKVAFQLKFKFLITIIVCGVIFCGYKRLHILHIILHRQHLRSVLVFHQRILIPI